MCHASVVTLPLLRNVCYLSSAFVATCPSYFGGVAGALVREADAACTHEPSHACHTDRTRICGGAG